MVSNLLNHSAGPCFQRTLPGCFHDDDGNVGRLSVLKRNREEKRGDLNDRPVDLWLTIGEAMLSLSVRHSDGTFRALPAFRFARSPDVPNRAGRVLHGESPE